MKSWPSETMGQFPNLNFAMKFIKWKLICFPFEILQPLGEITFRRLCREDTTIYFYGKIVCTYGCKICMNLLDHLFLNFLDFKIPWILCPRRLKLLKNTKVYCAWLWNLKSNSLRESLVISVWPLKLVLLLFEGRN